MTDWKEIHDEILALGRDRARHEHALGRALRRAVRARVWEALGMATIVEYAERHAGLSPRQTEERLRVATALEGLPLLDAALAQGQLHFSIVREVSRIAMAHTEGEWIERVRGLASLEVARLVTGRVPGDRPDDPTRPEARRHKVTLDLSAEVYATFREARSKLRREGFSEGQAVLLMARAALGGPVDAGRSAYQIHLTVCPQCRGAEQRGGGRPVVVAPEVDEKAWCDAQVLPLHGPAAQEIPPATRRAVVARQHGGCGVPGCRNEAFTEIHHVFERPEERTHDPDRLIVLCSAHHGAVHRGALRIEGGWSAGLRFLHADGSTYGSPEVDASREAIFRQVHLAMRNLGWSEREVRGFIAGVRPRVTGDAKLEEVLRMTLRASMASTAAA